MSLSVTSLETNALPSFWVSTKRIAPAWNFLSLRKLLTSDSVRNVFRKLDRKIEVAKNLKHRFGFLQRKARLFDGNPERRGHAKADRFTVEVAAVAGGVFYGVANRVAEVEQSAHSEFLKLIFRDDRSFDLFVSCDQGLKVAGNGFRQRVEHCRVADHRVLDDFGDPFVKFAPRQSGERRGVGDDQHGLVKASDEILAVARIDAGLPANCAIDLGDDGCRNLDVRDAAVIDSRREAGQVAHDAAPQRRDKGASIEACGNHLVAKPFRARQRLRVLPGRHGDKGCREPRAFERRDYLPGIKRSDVRIADDGALARRQNPARKIARPRENAASDDDFVRIFGKADGNARDHREGLPDG